MCGIAGVLGGAGGLNETVARMTATLAHRGPDDEGVWVDRQARVGLGHRRLSIIDLSPAGHQPMLSPSGRFVITLNGEIYNYGDLRKELEASGHGFQWRGHSDTEVLLAGFQAWGIGQTLERASGMFALGVWDKKERALFLARDRLGEKPLYYGRQHGPKSPFLFGSELKALLSHPCFDATVDREALALFVRFLAVPAPKSIYRGISKLMPGTLLTVRDGAEPVIEPYWSGAEVARSGVANRLDLSPEAAADELESILDRAIGQQMMADVPLGAFLSGGVDSSTVVAIMQKLSARPVKTFTVGFHEKSYDEAAHARAVAAHLGTDHTERYVSPAEALDVIPALSAMYDEPFGDSSQIPTHLIAALARQQVTVALSGDGGDELFAGYDRYLFTAGMWSRTRRIPRPLRAVVARALNAVPARLWTRFGDAAGGLLPRPLRVQRLGDKVHKGAAMLRSGSHDELYRQMLSPWPVSEEVVIGVPAERESLLFDSANFEGLGGIERMMAQDMLGYLPNDILVKVDRAAMAVSLETRVPLLDPEVVSFAWHLPMDMKLRGGKTKWLLRQVLYRHVPPKLIDRPKMGFAIPLDDWLRGPLRDWAEALIEERRLAREGYFHPILVRRAWDEQLNGRTNSAKLWTILMFQSWLESQQSCCSS